MAQCGREAFLAIQTTGYTVRPDQRQFWSFQPLAKPVAPKNQGLDLGRERYRPVRAGKPGKERHEAHHSGLTGEPWIRRLAYDLTGLPPTFEEVKAFENDKSPNAYEKIGGSFARLAALWRDVGPALVGRRAFPGESDYRVGEKKNHEEKCIHSLSSTETG